MRRNLTGRPIDVEAHLEDLRAYLGDREGLVAAWIFGSYGTPYQTPLSDLDLALLYRPDAVPDFKERARVHEQIMDILREEDVSVTILNSVPVLLQFRVLETGRRLVCRNEIALAGFVERVLNEHGDYIIDHQRFIQEYDRALLERYSS